MARKPSKRTSGAGTSSAGGVTVVEEGKKKAWVSKDRFAAKRLRAIADNLAPKKRAVIEEKSAFRALLNVAPFRIPNELIDFIAEHTTPQLREYKYHKKKMVFTRDMVRKVFGIRCGNKPVVLLKKSDYCELRDVYKAGSIRPEIATAVKMLSDCNDTDEETIIRSWDLLCLAMVVAPKSSNHINLEYLACMEDPTKSHEYAWDEHFLELAMQSVDNIQKKKALPLVLPKGATSYKFWATGPFALLGITYMDHLAFPPHNHVFDLSLPRICSVKSSDFTFVVKNDIDRLMLNNTTVFGRREFLPLNRTPYAVNEPPPVEEPEVNPSASLNEWLHFPSSQEMEVPARFMHLYEKHKAIFASDVDATAKNLAVGLKRMQSQRMSALLVEIDAAIKGEGASVEFQTTAPMDDDPGLNDDDDQSEDNDAAKEREADKSESEEDEEQIAAAKERDSDEFEAQEDEEQIDAAAGDDEQEGAAEEFELVARSGVQDVPQIAVLALSATMGGDVGKQQPVDSPLKSPCRYSPPEGVSIEAWERALSRAPDPPSFELFSQEDGDNQNEEVDVAAAFPSDKPNAATAEKPAAEKVEAAAILGEAVTPADPKEPGVVAIELKTKDASSGFVTHEKKTRCKRAAREELTPPKMKKIKVSEDVNDIYDKFVANGRKLKRRTKGKPKEPACFVEIGRYFTCYQAFQSSLLPRQYLDSEVMNVWIEKFNHEAQILSKRSPRQKKKYAFTQSIVNKLIVDPEKFDAKACMGEFMQQNEQYKILKNDLLYFPIVKNSHWVVPCTNMMCKQFHIFDSMKGADDAGLLDECARNLFANFAILVKESKLAPALNFDLFPLKTPDHPQQVTLYDCGFFSILFMLNFSGKVMAEFDNNVIPDLRKAIAAELIEARTNKVSVEELMEKELQKKKLS